MRGSQHPEMSEAQRLAQMIQSNDLVVGDWDGVSVAYGYAWAADGQFFSFTSNAASFGTMATSIIIFVMRYLKRSRRVDVYFS